MDTIELILKESLNDLIPIQEPTRRPFKTFIESIVEHGSFRSTILEAYQIAFEAIYAPHVYVSPRWRELTPDEVHIRDVAYSIKNGSSAMIKEAARDMAKFVDPKNILVPIPSSKGSLDANFALANEISRLTGAVVVDALGIKTPRESNRELSLAGKERLPPKKLGFNLRGSIRADRVLFIDNVSASGSTIQAACNLLNGGNGLVYAKVEN